MNLLTEVRYRAAELLWSLFAAIILLSLTQWILGMCDWHIAYPWNRAAFVVVTILIWSPWRKLNLPKNQGNNDLFPG